jgi:hypothetical protein
MIERTANIVTSDGILKMTSKDWGGLIYRIQKDEITPTILDSDLLDGCAGIYILVGKKDIRVGKGDIYARLSSHRASKDPNRNFFDYAIVITSPVSGLDDTQQGYIEHKWIDKLKDNKKRRVTNDTTPVMPSNIQEHDRVSSDKFMATAEKFIYDICNDDIFGKKQSQPKTTPVKTTLSTTPTVIVSQTNAVVPGPIGEEFVCKTRFCEAMGIYVGDNRVKVLKGSKGRLNVSPCFSTHSCSPYFVQREDLIKENKLVSDGTHYIFQDDVEFGSPSAASSVVMGNPSTGKKDWKRKSDGKMLGELL